MIANTSSGRRFAPLATYLISGRSGTETDRVAWTASRNLGTDDPELAAPLMQATARRSALVQVPVYHLTISFDREDQVTPDQIQAVADRVLRDLGLAAHQAMMVAHKDREHAHVHVMVNRVHPETGVTWERWQDRPTIERALREAERAFGLRIVPGRLHQLDGHDVPARAALTPGERREAERSGDSAFPDRVRVLLPELRAARSWHELTSRLAAQGLRVEGKGQGLVITDGEHQVKASRAGRDLSLRRLEARFGTPYPGRDQLSIPTRVHEQLSPEVAAVASAAREYEYVAALVRARHHTDQDLALLRARRERFEHTLAMITRASEAFDRALAPVYREPEAARAQIRATAATLGADRVELMLRAEPDRFGALKTEATTRALGLLTVHDDAPARLAARGAATEWNALASHEAASVQLALDYVRGVEQRLSDALTRVYRDPEAARRAFELPLGHAGKDEAIRTLAESPDRLGAVLAPTSPAPVARLAWLTLADRGREAIDARLVTSTALAEAHVDRAIATVDERRRGLRDALKHAPGPDLLQRMLGVPPIAWSPPSWRSSGASSLRPKRRSSSRRTRRSGISCSVATNATASKQGAPRYTMITTPHTLNALRERWFTRRYELRRLHALVDGAVLCDELLAELDPLTDDAANEPLSLHQAFEESGYSVDHLARDVRAGRIPNAGLCGSARLRRVAHGASMARAQTLADIARYFGADAIEGEPAILTGDEEQAAVARYKDRGGFAA